MALAPMRAGRGDPTMALEPGGCWRATRTPDGPGTVHISWHDGVLDASAWGPGAEWLLAQVPAMTGALDAVPTIEARHDAVAHALHHHPNLRMGASGTLYHDLLPTVLAQRITGGEAVRQWSQLVRAAGETAPGPRPDLLLPPAPDVLARRPTWWFHPLGIEVARARTLVEIARHAHHLWAWAALDPVACEERLRLLRGVGVWTAANVRSISLGDPDAVLVGDYHVKHQICWALAGRARGTDEQMLELLEPYAGQRGRVVRALLLDGWTAPKFGPRQRVVPMTRW
jgi:3-methyladenine DNA glycosylase/8-oxoguanine DNA glycosylase